MTESSPLEREALRASSWLPALVFLGLYLVQFLLACGLHGPLLVEVGAHLDRPGWRLFFLFFLGILPLSTVVLLRERILHGINGAMADDLEAPAGKTDRKKISGRSALSKLFRRSLRRAVVLAFTYHLLLVAGYLRFLTQNYSLHEDELTEAVFLAMLVAFLPLLASFFSLIEENRRF